MCYFMTLQDCIMELHSVSWCLLLPSHRSLEPLVILWLYGSRVTMSSQSSCTRYSGTVPTTITNCYYPVCLYVERYYSDLLLPRVIMTVHCP